MGVFDFFGSNGTDGLDPLEEMSRQALEDSLLYDYVDDDAQEAVRRARKRGGEYHGDSYEYGDPFDDWDDEEDDFDDEGGDLDDIDDDDEYRDFDDFDDDDEPAFPVETAASSAASWRGPTNTVSSPAPEIKEPLHTGRNCAECVFWSGTQETTRGDGCRICYAVELEYGGALKDVQPMTDGLTCEHFAPGNGVPVLCYDCIHWHGNALGTDRTIACAVWGEEHLAFGLKLRRLADDRLGPDVRYHLFETSYPYDDREVCGVFEQNPEREPGYGQRRAELDREHLEKHVVRREFAYVVGNTSPELKAMWRQLEHASPPNVVLVPNHNLNPNRNVIAVYANGEYGGYLSAESAKPVQSAFDAGYQVAVTSCKITYREHKDKLVVSLSVMLSRPRTSFDGPHEVHRLRDAWGTKSIRELVPCSKP